MKKGDLLCFLQTILQDELIAQIELQDNLLTSAFRTAHSVLLLFYNYKRGGRECARRTVSVFPPLNGSFYT